MWLYGVARCSAGLNNNSETPAEEIPDMFDILKYRLIITTAA